VATENEMQVVGIIGARSLVGESVVQMLSAQKVCIVRFTRVAPTTTQAADATWRELSAEVGPVDCNSEVSNWIYLAPIWTICQHFSMLQAYGVKRIVALSSTSRFTKYAGSSAANSAENLTAKRLSDGEDQFKEWATKHQVEWIILRPTLIYGDEYDKNISVIKGFIRRFGFFPIFGNASGLRQPVHVKDVASVSIAALQSTVINGEYNISGGETLSYRLMVSRLFEEVYQKPRFIRIPLTVFRCAVAGLRFFPKFRHWSYTMAQRMNQDHVFDHSDATRDFGYSPTAFLQ
jgi:nucleoside-diphosphate-sugar epimerase